ncbi:sodium:proton antiporter [Tenuifilum osseticum]|jgi:multicomponent Na+:H+ antiporter subunit C|uniref:sodium:proton antiporter n=1 Tax=Tenuifilum TaxID=2760873 RepID=UPI001B5BC633|nr:cation:proton antiporter subunit C [Bacteroidales bacterium]HOK60595.1 cation:proton antiporter subunit C [Tenuifilum sp.]MBP9029427.1 cation:proton antiporter subunit C [Bacteroidales bacterium]HOK84821.1 cation:proton antiporter subunit C [Tenuifilum sp.]HON69480.1 cation:proton antiporter subunit C [Tenuifilum sp.]
MAQYLTLEFLAMLIGFMLIVVGLWGMITQKNLIKIVIGFSLFDTGLNIVIVSMAYIKNSTAPIIDKAVDVSQAASKVADPVPQALVLTSIVIGLGVTALMLAYVLRMYREKKSLDINSYTDLKW